MGPNDVELVIVFARRPGDEIADVAFQIDQDIEVVVEAEAGTAILALGPKFKVGVLIRDLTDNTIIPKAPDWFGEALGSASWSTASAKFVFKISSRELGDAKEDHILETIAFLRVGMQNPDVSFARSSLFCITAP